MKGEKMHIPSHRYSTPQSRKNHEKIFGKKKRKSLTKEIKYDKSDI